ncbi:MAG: amidohydrolase family protein [Chloroflexaceae bacterium]
MLQLDHLTIVDHHAHNLLRPEALNGFSLAAAFTEGYDAAILTRHVQHTLFFKRSMRQLADLLGCAPSLEALQTLRDQLGYEPVAQRLFDAGGFAALILDDGFTPDRIMPTPWHERFAPTFRLIRIEHLGAQLLTRTPTWSQFVDAFRAGLEQRDPAVVGFKSIVAYRSGLRLAPADPSAASQAFARMREAVARGTPARIATKPLNDWLVWTMMEIAAREAIPVQFHTGFGDPDLDLREANPLHLRALLERADLRPAPVVLLHAGYPFTRELGYLAAVYPNVYLDVGLAIPYLSRAGMEAVFSAALELAPISKILFSTDAHLIPETFYVGARCGREVLATVLTRCVTDGDLTLAEAEAAALAILRQNAIALYRLPL